MRRDVFDQEHQLFREQVRRFVEIEVVPKVPHWKPSTPARTRS